MTLTTDDLIEADAIADQLRAEAGYSLEETVDMVTLVTELTGLRPRKMRMRIAGAFNRADPRPRLYTRIGLPLEREPETLGHELGHWHYWRRERVLDPVYEERMADAIGAALVAPRAAFLPAVRAIGARPHVLARAFHTSQGLALLRVGETSGRPVILIRHEPIARGEPFEWGPNPLRLPRSVAHPIRVDGRWGVMAAA